MTVLQFPSPRFQLIERTGYPRWVTISDQGVSHRIFGIWTEGRNVYFETICGRYGNGRPHDHSSAERLCLHCAKRHGWHPSFDTVAP